MRIYCLDVPSVVPKRIRVSKHWKDFTFHATLESIGIGKWYIVDVHCDKPDNDNVCRKHVRKRMAVDHFAKSAAVSIATDRQFSCTSNSRSGICIRNKVVKDNWEFKDHMRACWRKNYAKLQKIIFWKKLLVRRESQKKENKRKEFEKKRILCGKKLVWGQWSRLAP